MATNPNTIDFAETVATWESNMVHWGKVHADALAAVMGDPDINHSLGLMFYDALRVFQNIADYTHDPIFQVAANNSLTVYRDRYVMPNNGAVPAYWEFAEGLYRHWLRTKDPRSKEAIRLLSFHAAYADDPNTNLWTADITMVREGAFAATSIMLSEATGEPHRARLDQLIEQLLGHVDQWFIGKTSVDGQGNIIPTPFVQPFMVGLVLEALILYYDLVWQTKVRFPGNAIALLTRIEQAIATAADGLWESNLPGGLNVWDAATNSFTYLDRYVPSEGYPTPSPDLNMLIAPAYGFAWQATGIPKYRDRGDLIFAGAVRGAYLEGYKQFNQAYRWSFEYLRRRAERK